MSEEKCGRTWKAPSLLAPGAPREVVSGNVTVPVHGDRVYVEQECSEPTGHDGPHRSLSNVTKDIARPEPILCAWCGEPIAAEWDEKTGYHPWCVEQIEDDIAMEDIR